MNTFTTAQPFADRLTLALAACVARYEERDGFLSDDDVLDIATDWTTSDMSWLHDDEIDPDDPRIDTADRDQLLDALLDALYPQDAQ